MRCWSGQLAPLQLSSLFVCLCATFGVVVSTQQFNKLLGRLEMDCIGRFACSYHNTRFIQLLCGWSRNSNRRSDRLLCSPDVLSRSH